MGAFIDGGEDMVLTGNESSFNLPQSGGIDGRHRGWHKYWHSI